mmetsp:Transcript_22566/g.26155  ORF Transcript_22566/g.26155 Transcript_22566/m.26155 type:complete len:81 (-) Transcript_22566:808-1050(-)
MAMLQLHAQQASSKVQMAPAKLVQVLVQNVSTQQAIAQNVVQICISKQRIASLLVQVISFQTPQSQALEAKEYVLSISKL